MEGNKGEVRRLHIIYFLSRMGNIDHPHLIRVHHLNRNGGVYLRDVKRWMADLRGKDMPEAFAWSYKRRYKNGYVWQDLSDDDLITPISDNEYVLKGSQVLIDTPATDDNYGENKFSMSDEHNVEVTNEDKQEDQSNQRTYPDFPMKTSSEIYQESPSSEGSTLTDDSSTQEQNPRKNHEQALTQEFHSLSSSSFNSNQSSSQDKKKETSSSSIQKVTNSPRSPLSSPQSSQSAKKKSYSSGASKMLRNLMTCGAIETNDAALVTVDKSYSYNARVCSITVPGTTTWNQQQRCNARKNFDGVKDSKQHQHSGFGNPKGVPAAYKPVGAPICSQCGKSFKPEKLHTHMKSCKGMKASAKTTAASAMKTHKNLQVVTNING